MRDSFAGSHWLVLTVLTAVCRTHTVFSHLQVTVVWDACDFHSELL
jgi:hypothetical protein